MRDGESIADELRFIKAGVFLIQRVSFVLRGRSRYTLEPPSTSTRVSRAVGLSAHFWIPMFIGDGAGAFVWRS